LQAPSAFEAILQRVNTWDPDLIVMATHGRVGMTRWLLGSLAEKVVRHAPCSVVTVRPPEGEREAVGSVERVVVPIDFSDHSRRAVAAALGLLADDGSLVLHHVVLNPMLSGLAPSALRLFSQDPSLTKRVRARMEDWMEGQPFEAEITEAGDVANSILEVAEAKKADLLVMGTRGRTGLDYFLTGSVAEKIVRACSIPVMTVK
jgi:nucleotide-binding universal stress UspA family protein